MELMVRGQGPRVGLIDFTLCASLSKLVSVAKAPPWFSVMELPKAATVMGRPAFSLACMHESMSMACWGAAMHAL